MNSGAIFPDDEDCVVCPACDALVDGTDECSLCGAPGCHICLVDGDDCYPLLCEECAGIVDSDGQEIAR